MLEKFKQNAKDLGFITVGFSKPERPLYFEKFRAWISDGKNANMAWLERNVDLRRDPSRLLKGCKTIVSLAYPYSSQKPGTPEGYTVSRYSQPDADDYHDGLKRLCSGLVRAIEESYPQSRSRVCVDSAPLLERSFACESGIGFMGKNNMLIIPGYGSYFYLAEILTTASLGLLPVTPKESQCGTCRLCIDACPTGALEKPFSLDASKCLSYLTIEHKGSINEESGRKMGDCFFGCDRCQEVCPFNDGQDSRQILLPSTDEFLKMRDKEFKDRFGKTAFGRAGLEKLQSNIRALRAYGETAFLPKLKAS